MDKKIKQKWLKALRSGKYKQGKYQLRREDSFCCLGVLCDIHSKEQGISWEESTSGTNEISENSGNFEILLPPKVELWSGLANNDVLRQLVSKNDDEGASFKEIADIIDTNL